MTLAYSSQECADQNTRVLKPQPCPRMSRIRDRAQLPGLSQKLDANTDQIRSHVINLLATRDLAQWTAPGPVLPFSLEQARDLIQ